MPTELEIKKDSQMRFDYNAINNVAQKMSEKTGISIDKVKIELSMGIILGIMMNKHRIQEINEKK